MDKSPGHGDVTKETTARLVIEADRETNDKNPFLASVEDWDNRSILEMFVVMSARSWDAMIRIYFAQVDASQDPASWKIIYQNADLKPQP